ncbi:MAG: hypothetical protein R6W88_13330 [Desulfobacterales bacterium]
MIDGRGGQGHERAGNVTGKQLPPLNNYKDCTFSKNFDIIQKVYLIQSINILKLGSSSFPGFSETIDKKGIHLAKILGVQRTFTKPVASELLLSETWEIFLGLNDNGLKEGKA